MESGLIKCDFSHPLAYALPPPPLIHTYTQKLLKSTVEGLQAIKA